MAVAYSRLASSKSSSMAGGAWTSRHLTQHSGTGFGSLRGVWIEGQEHAQVVVVFFAVRRTAASVRHNRVRAHRTCRLSLVSL